MTGSESAKYNGVQQKGYIIDLEVTEQMAHLFEEMESVLYSISFGKQEDYGSRTKYQAFSAAISHQNHVDLVLNYVGQRRGI
jgi:hypothetical protein